MKFVFDIDDTICDTDGYSEYYINKFIKEHKLPFKQIKKATRYADGKFDWSEEEAELWYKQYGDNMALDFPCKKDAVKILNGLYDLGHEIILCTARSTDWHVDPEGVTKDWLRKNGINYNKIYFARVDKEKVCECENADFFIDDDIGITANVKLHLKNKIKDVYLMTSLYNKDKSQFIGVKRIDNYFEFIEDIKKHGIYLNSLEK